MERYIWIKHTLNDKGLMADVSALNDELILNKYKILYGNPSQDGKDWYISLYTFPKDAFDYFIANNKSVSGYNGPAFANRLFFDFDSKEDVSLSQTDAQEVIIRLQNAGIVPEQHVKVYFSGNKGFHIEVPLATEIPSEDMKNICKNICSGLKTFDPVIYNTTRIIRVVDTQHQASGLYKIQLDPSDLWELTLDQIKEKAKTITDKAYESTPLQDVTLLDRFKAPTKFKPVQVVTSVDDDGIRGLQEIDFTMCPKTRPRCIHALEQGIMVPGQGERSALYLRIAAYYRNQGFNKEGAYNLLKSVARLNSRLYPDAEPYTKAELWNNVIGSSYSKDSAWKPVPGASGTDPENELLKKYCDVIGKYTNKPCCLHSEVQIDKTVIQIADVFTSFDKFATDFDKNVVRTGIKFIDTHMKIASGTSNLLVGAAGSGKTTVALNMLENATLYNQDSIFFSMDMHKNLIYLKLAQKCTNYSKDQIFEFHKNKDKAKIDYVRQAIADKYKLTHFDFSTTLTFDQMRDKTLDMEQKVGRKMKLALVDYASRIQSNFSDTYANARHNALKSVEVADVTDAAWVILSQISRAVGDGCSPLRTKRAAKESGDWEEASTNVITIWRPFMGAKELDDVMRIFLAKNRMGPELETILDWNGAKGQVKDLTEDQLKDYATTRGDKAEREYLKSRAGRD